MATCIICRQKSSNYLYVQTTPAAGRQATSDRFFVCGEHIGSLAAKLRSEHNSQQPRIFLGSTFQHTEAAAG